MTHLTLLPLMILSFQLQHPRKSFNIHSMTPHSAVEIGKDEEMKSHFGWLVRKSKNPVTNFHK